MIESLLSSEGSEEESSKSSNVVDEITSLITQEKDTTKYVTNPYSERRFWPYGDVELAKPLPGLQHTLCAFGTRKEDPPDMYAFGRSSKTGLPYNFNNENRDNPQYPQLLSPEDKLYLEKFNKLKEVALKYDWFSDPENKKALEKLAGLKVKGHSVTESSSQRRYNSMYNIMMFGLWSSHESFLWATDFKSNGTAESAANYFKGYAAILPDNDVTKYISPEDGGGCFVPPLELKYIVPNQEIKDALLELLNGKNDTKN